MYKQYVYIRIILSDNCGRTANLVQQVCDAVIVYNLLVVATYGQTSVIVYSKK